MILKVVLPEVHKNNPQPFALFDGFRKVKVWNTDRTMEEIKRDYDAYDYFAVDEDLPDDAPVRVLAAAERGSDREFLLVYSTVVYVLNDHGETIEVLRNV